METQSKKHEISKLAQSLFGNEMRITKKSFMDIFRDRIDTDLSNKIFSEIDTKKSGYIQTEDVIKYLYSNKNNKSTFKQELMKLQQEQV